MNIKWNKTIIYHLIMILTGLQQIESKVSQTTILSGVCEKITDLASKNGYIEKACEQGLAPQIFFNDDDLAVMIVDGIDNDTFELNNLLEQTGDNKKTLATLIEIIIDQVETLREQIALIILSDKNENLADWFDVSNDKKLYAHLGTIIDDTEKLKAKTQQIQQNIQHTKESQTTLQKELQNVDNINIINKDTVIEWVYEGCKNSSINKQSIKTLVNTHWTADNINKIIAFAKQVTNGSDAHKYATLLIKTMAEKKFGTINTHKDKISSAVAKLIANNQTDRATTLQTTFNDYIIICENINNDIQQLIAPRGQGRMHTNMFRRQ